MKAKLRKSWWEEPKGQAHKEIVRSVRWLDEMQSHMRQRTLHYQRLYDSFQTLGLDGGDYNQHDGDRGQLRINVVQSVIDAAVSRIGTLSTLPTALTYDGDFALQQRAKKMNKFVAGVFYTADQESISEDVFRDAAIHGTGVEKIFERNGKVCAERVLPGELLVDDTDARDGNPRQYYHVRQVSREQLVRWFPRSSEAILRATLIRTPTTTDTLANVVDVVEAWHLPSGEGAKDGRRVMCIDNETLIDEKWDDECAPFAVFRWQKRSYGFWGRGVAELLSGIQIEIDKLGQRIQNIMNLNVPHLVMAPGLSKPARGKFTNEEMTIIEANPNEVALLSPNAVPTEYFQERANLIQSAYDLIGLSQLYSSGNQQRGASGRAVRLMNDIQSLRFLHVQRGFERFQGDVADLMISLARRIDERGDGSIKIMAINKDSIEKIEWSDVAMDGDEFVLRVHSSSMIDQLPSARLETAVEMMEAVPELRKYAVKMLAGHPDLERISALESAPQEIVDQMISQMIETGAYMPPEPFMNLAYAIERTQNTYLLQKMRGTPDERLELLRQFMVDCEDMMRPPAPPPMAAPMPPPSAPEQMPMDMAMGPPMPDAGMVPQ